MAPPRRRGGAAGAAAGGPAKKRSRPKKPLDLSGHGGRYEDLDDVAPTLHDEDVASDEDDDFRGDRGEASEEEGEEEEETVDAKRLRLAKEYLQKMEAQESSSSDGGSDSDDDDDDDDAGRGMDRLGRRMAKERLRRAGLMQARLADSVLEGVQALRSDVARSIGAEAASKAWMGGAAGDAEAENYAKAWRDAKHVTYHRGHDLSPTSVALAHDGHRAYSGAKDGSLFQWNVEEGRKMACVLPVVRHFEDRRRNGREILAVAASDDDRYLAVGGRDRCVRIFDVRTIGAAAAPVATLEGHKGAVASLAFRARTLDLYSGSDDRCIRRYDLTAMTYVETLYGHQSGVVGMDCAHKNRPVSVARDRTARVWKVEEDSHLVFRPGGDVGSAECVAAVRDGWFVTGHDDGRLALWREEKKRPVGDVVVAAHGHRGGASGVTRSVLCCDAVRQSDVLATGSSDGYLRLWRVSTAEKGAGIEPLDAVPIHGHINDVAVGPGGKFCVAAVGQEPRLGRWDRVPRAKNRFAVVRLSVDAEEEESSSEESS